MCRRGIKLYPHAKFTVKCTGSLLQVRSNSFKRLRILFSVYNLIRSYCTLPFDNILLCNNSYLVPLLLCSDRLVMVGFLVASKASVNIIYNDRSICVTINFTRRCHFRFRLPLENQNVLKTVFIKKQHQRGSRTKNVSVLGHERVSPMLGIHGVMMSTFTRLRMSVSKVGVRRYPWKTGIVHDSLHCPASHSLCRKGAWHVGVGLPSLISGPSSLIQLWPASPPRGWWGSRASGHWASAGSGCGGWCSRSGGWG